ncbi:copper resistance protein CopC [uncultured Friedmanniella sp.]|uniref:copper resistance CopC family protein n=1 Tax=uncultured Friedmanniella sp. TaxID=335381 RepID=UPI0035C9D02D
MTLAVRLILVLAGAAFVLVAAAGPAAAHDVLTRTAPGNGATVAVTPASVVLTFDAPAIALGTKIDVTGPSGPIQQGAPVLVDNTVTQALQPGAPAGRYTVEWRITSADGHPVSGSFTFAARAAGTGDPASAASPASAPAIPAGASSAVWPWLVAVGLLSFVVVGAVALGRRAVAQHED